MPQSSAAGTLCRFVDAVFINSPAMVKPARALENIIKTRAYVIGCELSIAQATPASEALNIRNRFDLD
ncbi:hypothetical protein C1J03_10925 [Sulfitobacter sp. SK012]|uniref:hypothetical protein n=1 Tax=Sulfitobacter sp. SK012 TaxID=1389005 RepID=UPI000E0A8122|nr:hypothetical protein [Sulfitobacter sp. SK012]AXI46488.1 hypothetical protein C1J03_10925 [Sulfitobacter sp. SK012]